MKRKFYFIIPILILALFAFAACQPRITEPTEFTVTVVGGTGGGVFEKDASCTVTAAVDVGYEFVEWQIEGVGVSADVSYTFTVSGDVTLTAVTKAKPEPKPDPEPDPEPSLDLGAFARKWVSKDGALDLVNRTWTLFDSFEAVSVEGEGVLTVINCIADGSIPYKLSLTDDGKLQATDVEFPELTHAFMPAADVFSGLWSADGEDEAYLLLISELDENGMFGWTAVDSDGSFDLDYVWTAETKLVFKDGGEAEVQFVNDGLELTYVINGDGNLVVTDGSLLYKPVSKLYADCYVDSDGTVYALDAANGVITVDGCELDMTLKCGEYGAGLYFVRNQSSYALIKTLNGVSLYSDGGSKPARPFAFLGSYSNGADELTVGGALTVTVGANVYDDCSVVVLTDLERLDEIAPIGYAGLQQTAISFDNGSKYLIWVEGGVAVVVKDKTGYVIQSAYFSHEALSKLQARFTAGLRSPDDAYTTGGTTRIAVKPDFSNGAMIVNGVSVPFTWHYVIRATGDEYAALSFTADIFGAEYDCLFYPYFDYDYVRLEMTNEAQSKTVRKLASQSLYEQMLGTSYFARYDGYTEGIDFAADGALTVVTGKQNNVLRVTQYDLEVEYGKDVLVVIYVDPKEIDFEVYIYCDRIGVSVSIFDVYANAALLEAVGVYCDANGHECLELLSDTRFKFNPDGIADVKAQQFTDIRIDGSVITCTYNGGTVVFTNGKSTLTTADGKTVEYSKKSDQSQTTIPDEYLGAYTDGKGTVCFELLADGAFRYDVEGLSDGSQVDSFDKIEVLDGKYVASVTRKTGLVNSTVTFVFDGTTLTVTVDDGDPLVYAQQQRQIPSEFVGSYADEDGDVLFVLLEGGLFAYQLGSVIDDFSDAESFDKIRIDGSKTICSKTYSVFGSESTITFVFEGDTVTIIDDGNDPVVYVKQ